MTKQHAHRPKDKNQLAKLIVDLATGDDVKEEDKKPKAVIKPELKK